MELIQVAKRLETLSREMGFSFWVGEEAQVADIEDTQVRLSIRLPDQVRLFYLHYNGLEVSDPKVRIFRLDQLYSASPNRIHFAVFDDRHNFYFDVSRVNSANQWNIVGEDDRLLTLTMASFWSSKIWMWIKHRREFWREEEQLYCD